MQINEQALLNATLSAVVLGGQLGYKVPEVLKLVSVLALSVSLLYSLKSLTEKPATIPQ